MSRQPPPKTEQLTHAQVTHPPTTPTHSTTHSISTHQLAVDAESSVGSDAAPRTRVAVEQVMVPQQGGMEQGLRRGDGVSAARGGRPLSEQAGGAGAAGSDRTTGTAPQSGPPHHALEHHLRTCSTLFMKQVFPRLFSPRNPVGKPSAASGRKPPSASSRCSSAACPSCCPLAAVQCCGGGGRSSCPIVLPLGGGTLPSEAPFPAAEVPPPLAAASAVCSARSNPRSNT